MESSYGAHGGWTVGDTLARAAVARTSDQDSRQESDRAQENIPGRERVGTARRRPRMPHISRARMQTRSVRTMSLFGLVGVLGLLLSAVAVSTTQEAAAGQVGTILSDHVNLREGPGKKYGVVTQMFYGEKVDVLYGPTDSGWYEIRYYGTHGYVHQDWIRLEPGGDLVGQGSSGGGGGGGSSEPEPEHWIDINRSNHAVTLYIGDQAQATYYASLGYDTSDQGFYATATGTYYVYAMYKPVAWTDWAQAYISNWVAFDPERHNGFHSWTMDANGNVLPNGDGKTGGCVATEPWASAQIYAFAYIGMRVKVHW